MALDISMGACFCLKIHKDLVEAVCAYLELTEFLPTELRRVLFAFARAQSVRPQPIFLAAISTLNGDFLEFYLFVGNDAEALGTIPGLQGTAASLQDHFRQHFALLIAEDSRHLTDHLTVTWEPNLLVTAE
ncbi:E4-ORFA [Bat mastadenovirus]|uniref:E4-ORFA n=1 Tax=Bat mastadenovirus TaxID=740971 RepID=A0A3G9ENG3_9ADEN|nr:E4-ORFA [Bat mastadenovirus]BBE29328.1 E4-ORFA [Bat mastadenovirus]